MSTTWLDLGRPLSIHDRHNPSSSTGAIDNPGSSSAGPSISDTTLSPASRIPQRYEGNYPVRASSAGIAAPLGDGYRTAASTWGASAQPGEPYMSDMGSLTRPGSYHEVDNPQSYPDDLDERNGRTLAVHPSTSPTNSSSTVHNESEKSQPQKQKFRDIGEPTDAHLEKAGVIAGATGAAHAGKKFLAQGGKEEPRGWEEVQMDEKYHIHHPQLREPRRAAIRVSDPLANRVLSGLIDRIVLSQKGAFIYGFITLWLWVCLSIFWGSTYKLETYFSRLTVHYVTFDTDPNSFLNAPMLNEVQYEAALPRSIPHLGWEVHDASEYPNGLEDVKQEVYSQKCWGAVVINANATSAWRAALANGDATYDPTGSIGLYFASARFYQVTLLYIEAFVSGSQCKHTPANTRFRQLVQALSHPLATARGQALQSFVSSSAGNVNAIALAQKVPQALGVGFGYTIFDLRSIQNSAWSSAAPMEASLIYFVRSPSSSSSNLIDGWSRSFSRSTSSSTAGSHG